MCRDGEGPGRVRDFPIAAVHACVCRDGEQAWCVTFQSQLCMHVQGGRECVTTAVTSVHACAGGRGYVTIAVTAVHACAGGRGCVTIAVTAVHACAGGRACGHGIACMFTLSVRVFTGLNSLAAILHKLVDALGERLVHEG